jgi:hypothetical protein
MGAPTALAAVTVSARRRGLPQHRGQTPEPAKREILGFVAGAGVIVILGTHKTLGIDAATFGMSALIVLIGVRARPTPGARSSPACPVVHIG